MPVSFGDKILQFNKSLNLDHARLPNGIKALNPFKGKNTSIIDRVTTEFYHKYYSDNLERIMILGINPGRFGAGVTGIPFSDTKRLNEICEIEINELKTHEPSSVFVYEVIKAFGGPQKFYKKVFITSICPLGFVKLNEAGKEVNYNFYDHKELVETVTPFILNCINDQLSFGISRKKAVILGTGKNFKFFQKVNNQHHFFDEIIPVEHPRYVMQYKHKMIKQYVEKYIRALSE